MMITSSLRRPLALLSFSLCLGLVHLGCGSDSSNAGTDPSGGNGKGGTGGKGSGGSGSGSGSGGSGGSTGSGSGGEGNGSGGSGNGSGTGGSGAGTGGSAGGTGGTTGGGTGIGAAPAAACNAKTDDAPEDALSFANNLLASPLPPGNLDVKNAPQIVVFGFDDIEYAEGMMFVNTMLGGVTNPNGSKASCNLNPNACYGGAAEYQCGNGTLASQLGLVTQNNFDIANHTLDHLENYQSNPWSGIPAKYKDTMNGGWKDMGAFGVGTFMDQPTWEMILKVNDNSLKTLYKAPSVKGFRAPRLEVNSEGLNALKAIGYEYDQDLEEILPENWVDALNSLDGDAKEGFNWISWPYTLDHGAPGIWNQQKGAGEKKWVPTYPTGIWEVPVYQLYPSDKSGLGRTIADRMVKSDQTCAWPDTVPADERKHCYLEDGEDVDLKDSGLREVTAFDFNTFIYGKFKPDEWLSIMKNTFLLRFYGNRAPLTYGAHPAEYSAPYDSYTLGMQPNNYGYRDVLQNSTYQTRQKAMLDFVAWIKADPVLSKETYFLSAAQMVAYMKAPFDKAGAKVPADAVATPAANGIFNRLTFAGDSARITVVDGNSADIVFSVVSLTAPVRVAAGVSPGAFKGVTHIDLSYNTEVPFRVRLLTADGSASTTVLLAGTGSDRVARIRIKDFFPGPEASVDDVKKMGFVNADYLSKVTGIAFESAATPVTGAKDFNTHIKQLTLRGVTTTDLCKP
jgi:hypothetical protein